jgi:hypothetical protein
MTDDELINKIRGVVKEEVKAAIDPINAKLDDPNSGLQAINKRLDDPEHGLEAMNRKIDALTADMMRVEKLTASTNDLVSIIKDKHEEELDEIRAHTHMLPAHRVSLKV